MERLLGVSWHALSRWLTEWAQQLPPLADTLSAVQLDEVLELDKVWSFVQKKDNQRWVGVELCRRPLVAYFIGDISATSCLQLWRCIPSAYIFCHSFSDFWEADSAHL